MLSKFAVAGKTKPKESNVTMDDILRRRLQNDGDGVGDERKMGTLLKGIQDFVAGDFSTEEADSRMTHLIGQLRQVEYNAKRTAGVIRNCKETSKVYDGVKNEIQSETVKTKEAITEAKYIIEQETKNRKHSMEYEALSKLIESKPDRKLTAEKRRQLKAEVKGLDELKEQLAQKVASREKHLKSLSVAIQLIKGHVDENIEHSKAPPAQTPALSTSSTVEAPADEPKPGPSTPPPSGSGGDPGSGNLPNSALADVVLSLISSPVPMEEISISTAPEHEFSQPAEPGSSVPSTSSATVKEKYEDLSEESPEEGESED